MERSVTGAEIAKSTSYEGPFLVDTHVHLHPCFDLGRFLDAARDNFDRAAVGDLGAGTLSGVLVLTEGASERNFARLADGSLRDPSNRWSFEPFDDGISLLARSTDEGRILIVAGRQIVSRERLEVLVIGSAVDRRDGRPFRDLVEEAAAGPGIAALPWGFGKWWGQRGKLMRESLGEAGPGQVFLADSGGRPRSLGRPGLMGWAVDRGHGLLLGTDPLPLDWQVNRPGRCGTVLRGSVSGRAPGEELLDLLRKGPRVSPQFGVRDSWRSFFRGQVGIRLSA